jgi:hypothetical protein
MTYAQANEMKTKNNGELDLEALPQSIKQEVQRVQESTADGIDDFQQRSLFRIQAIIQCRSHEERLRMLMAAFEEEEKDLVARAALRKFFA